MANLSQIKRNQMLNFLETLKEQHGDDESLIAINQIEREITSKKYGLVWENHEEEVDVMMNDYIPVFSENLERELIYNPENNSCNFLLEGDNLHSLKLLEKTHKGKIDIIYIDPPYNTGNKDFVYDDAYIDSLDGYKHSKWLSFMSKRLSVSRKLLSEKGVIFISISDIELYNLKLLCDSIFGEQNFVANLIWTNKEGGGSSDSKLFRIKHEYILVYAKNIDNVEISGVDISNADRYKSSDEYEKVRGKYYLQKLGMGSIQYSSSLDYPIETPDGSFVYPKDNNNGNKACWRWSKDKFEWGKDNGFIEIKKDSKGVWTVYTKQYMNCDNDGNYILRTQRPMGVIDSYSSTQGAKLIKAIFGEPLFSYPKDVNLVKYLIERIPSKNATVLDFFAGSGTTGQAVLELNSEDGGDRQFILCTNNENSICEDVTYKRIKTIITGKREDGTDFSEGCSSNLKYYSTGFVSKDTEDLSDELLQYVLEMIQLEYGTRIDNKKYVMILSDEDMDSFEKNYDNYNSIEAIFISHDVLLTKTQEIMIKDLNIYIIPDCYFDFELREVGELW